MGIFTVFYAYYIKYKNLKRAIWAILCFWKNIPTLLFSGIKWHGLGVISLRIKKKVRFHL